jgi:hypothetical protein
MSSNAKKPSGNDTSKEVTSERLPFEPASVKKKRGKKPVPIPAETPVSAPLAPKASPKGAVPEVVSRRMVRRMAAFSGIPSLLGMLTFVVSYLIVSNHLFKLPNTAVLLVSLGFFGLGVLGLSYGVFSASWEEAREGTWLGWGEFKLNIGRTVTSWQEARQRARAPVSNGNEE